MLDKIILKLVPVLCIFSMVSAPFSLKGNQAQAPYLYEEQEIPYALEVPCAPEVPYAPEVPCNQCPPQTSNLSRNLAIAAVALSAGALGVAISNHSKKGSRGSDGKNGINGTNGAGLVPLENTNSLNFDFSFINAQLASVTATAEITVVTPDGKAGNTSFPVNGGMGTVTLISPPFYFGNYAIILNLSEAIPEGLAAPVLLNTVGPVSTIQYVLPLSEIFDSVAPGTYTFIYNIDQ